MQAASAQVDQVSCRGWIGERFGFRTLRLGRENERTSQEQGTCDSKRVEHIIPLILSLAEPIAKAVRRNDVEHFPRHAAVFFSGEVGEFLLEPIGFEFCEQV